MAERPAREQVAAALAFADRNWVDPSHTCVLAAEVRALRAELDAVVPALDDGQCCLNACPSGACEICRCCAAGWCVTGADGLPEDAADLARWIESAAGHNPIVAAWRDDRDALVARTSQPAVPVEVVTLCGSMRFLSQMLHVAAVETAAGRVVLAPFSVVAPEDQGSGFKAMLDELHRRKIDMAGRVIVFSDATGYYGTSTTKEIAYAREQGKQVDFHRVADQPPQPVPADPHLAHYLSLPTLDLAGLRDTLIEGKGNVALLSAVEQEIARRRPAPAASIAAPLPAVPDGEDESRRRWAAWLVESAAQADDLTESEAQGMRIAATHLLDDEIAARVARIYDLDDEWLAAFTERLHDRIEAHRFAVRTVRAAAASGEDVPARLDAAAEALEAGQFYRLANDFHDAAMVLRERGTVEIRAAVAAALARPTERER